MENKRVNKSKWFIGILTLLIAASIVFYFYDSSPSDVIEIEFDESKWKEKEGDKHPFRNSMLNDLVYDKEIRKLKRNDLVDLLGKPDYEREDKNFLHYRIDDNKIGTWTLKTKTLVINIAEDSTINWMKIHE